MIPIVIYSLCILTCWSCAFLLWRGFKGNRSPLLLWSAVCFLFLGVSNLLLFADLVVYPDANLLTVRNAVTLAGLVIFIAGLVFKGN
jgi:hypothetical protein